MSYLDVYIGNLDDPEFNWEGGNWEGNIPRRISPFFPHKWTPSGYSPFSEVVERIRAGIYNGKQTDWGGWVARVTKKQIMELLDELYPPEWYRAQEHFPWILQQMEELKRFVESLDPSKEYALVAAEL